MNTRLFYLIQSGKFPEVSTTQIDRLIPLNGM